MFLSFLNAFKGLHHTYQCATISAAHVCMLWLHFTYGCRTSSAAYIINLYLQNRLLTLHFWVSKLNCHQSLLTLNTESLGYTTLINAPR